jgi:hypothetical protein
MKSVGAGGAVSGELLEPAVARSPAQAPAQKSRYQRTKGAIVALPSKDPSNGTYVS